VRRRRARAVDEARQPEAASQHSKPATMASASTETDRSSDFLSTSSSGSTDTSDRATAFKSISLNRRWLAEEHSVGARQGFACLGLLGEWLFLAPLGPC